MTVLLWIVAAVGLAVAELFTGTFVLLMLAGGAVAAAVTAAAGGELWAQALVFAVVSALAMVLARPALKRHLDREGAQAWIGLAAIEGSSGLVLERVDADHGLVKVDGELWQARSFDGTEVYEPGDRVQVIQVKGATAMVWRG